MPDDIKDEVTEQGEVEGQDEAEETPEDKGLKAALEAFHSEGDDEPPEKKADDDKGEEGDDDSEDEEEDPEKKPKVDEDEKRGQELIDQESEAKKEAKEADEAEQKRFDKEDADREALKGPDPYSQEEIDIFHNAVPDSLFPDKIKVGNEEIPFKTYLKENPEVKTISTIVAKYVVDTLIDNNRIATVKSIEDAIKKSEQKTVNQRFIDRVRDKVPEAIKIHQSDEFKKWLPDQSEKIQALDRSGKSSDKVKVLRRFMKDSGLKEVDEKVAVLDEKKRKAKEKDIGILSTTPKPKKKATPSKTSGLSPEEQERAGFDSSDEEEKVK